MFVLYFAVAVSDLQDPSDLVGWLRCSSLRSQEHTPACSAHSVRGHCEQRRAYRPSALGCWRPGLPALGDLLVLVDAVVPELVNLLVALHVFCNFVAQELHEERHLARRQVGPALAGR